MAHSAEQYIRAVMSGAARGLTPSLLRAGLAAVEPLYAGLMHARNLCYSHGILSVARLSRPVISVGNITSGGTGKTPVVRWLASRLRDAGRKPAILLRGYKHGGATLSDEQAMLQQQLSNGDSPPVRVYANPSRVAAAGQGLDEHPEIDAFVLDDGFQHRRVARDFDLVLLNAADPFGYGHVHPRGLLREPLPGLARAHAILLTHAGEATADAIAAIEHTLRRHNPDAPVYRADHAPTALHCSQGELAGRPLSELRDRRYFAFCGIGSPHSFVRQLQAISPACVGQRFYADHHHYREEQIGELSREARAAGAELLITTEKDWAKLRALAPLCPLPLWRLEMAIRFAGGDENALLERIRQALPAAACEPTGAYRKPGN